MAVINDQDQFEKQLQVINITEDQIKKQDPEFLITKIEQVFDLFKNQIMANRNSCLIESGNYLAKYKKEHPYDAEPSEANPALLHWKDCRQNIEISFGKWSHDFNRILRERITATDKIKTPKGLATVKKLNLVFLFWGKIKDYILVYNTINLFSIRRKLEELTAIRESVKKSIWIVRVFDYNEAAASYEINKEK